MKHSTYSSAVHAKAIELIRTAIEMTTEAQSGHPSSAASLAHIVAVLLYDRMRYDPARPDEPGADRLVLSEGHACPIVYAAGADLGFAIDDDTGRRRMERADVDRLRDGGPLEGHPLPQSGFPFFATATGSLGQGLSMAAGMALGARWDDLDRRIYCVVGDGESREGQVWEALDFLVDHGLDAVCPIFNCNGMGQTGAVSSQQSSARLAAKLDSFGFAAERVDGHDPEALRAVFAHHAAGGARPVAVVAETTKGWGSARMQGDMHGTPLLGDDAQVAIGHLDNLAIQLEAVLRPGVLRQREGTRPPARPVATADRPRDTRHVWPGFEQALATLDHDWSDRERIATRSGHGLALQLLGRTRPDIAVLDADVADSTRAGYFAGDDRVEGRFVQCRIGEQNMLSCAVGLAAAGKAPFVSTFGKFLVRAYDQLELALLGGCELKLVGSHVGVTPAADGPSQMALADVAFCRALGSVVRGDGTPQLYVLTPCDARAAYGLTMVMAAHRGACYLRTQRPEVPRIYETDAGFEPGGANVLVAGEHLAVFAMGYVVHEALRAVRELAAEGIRATLVDAYSLPIDQRRVLELARGNGGRVLTVEDNYGAGLGGAVAEILCGAGAPARIASMTVRRQPRSARSAAHQLERLGLDAQHIAAQARLLVGAR
ncbi:MAG: transketolase [Planctomycetota bacterium]